MIDDRFSSRICDWLKTGAPLGDVVVSTRVRLARNLDSEKMPWRMSAEDRIRVDDQLSKKISALAVPGVFDEPLTRRGVDDLDDHERTLLVERHLISVEHAEAEGRRSVWFTPDERLSIMTNEEDHLRLQSLRAGFQIEKARSAIDRVDDTLEKVVPYAISDDYGYLTTCPTNVGTGMRVSVMLHLPTLAHTAQIEKVRNAAAKMGLVLRGFRGEGSKASGDFYQVSNQVTLGRSEDEILADVDAMVNKIVDWERGLRAMLLRQNRVDIEDRVWRAWGTLRFARHISTEEILELLSSIRLGVHLKLLEDVKIDLINELFILTQPAHFQKLLGRRLEPAERDHERANFVRERLSS